MAGSPYASALGRLKPEFPAFLPKEMYATLLAAKDTTDLAKVLETTPYADDVAWARTSHPGPSMLEIAINRTFVRRNRHAYDADAVRGPPGHSRLPRAVGHPEHRVDPELEGPVPRRDRDGGPPRLEPRHPCRSVLGRDDPRRLPHPPRPADAGGDRHRARAVRLRHDHPAVPGRVPADARHLRHPACARPPVLPLRPRGGPVLPGRRVGRPGPDRERDRRAERPPPPKGEGRGHPDRRGALPLARGGNDRRLPGARALQRADGPRTGRPVLRYSSRPSARGRRTSAPTPA